MDHKVRIISGEWRGRKIAFSGAPGLRPTSDRMRETLFNWLQNKVYGARCLDLFSGSGVLSWEALSRGAKEATLFELNHRVVRDLRQTARTLGCEPLVDIFQKNAVHWLSSNGRKHQEKIYDLVFVDPPFSQNLGSQVLKLLSDQNILSDGAYIYLESNQGKDQTLHPPSLELKKFVRMGSVFSYLYVYSERPVV